jgi:hypothetical protein
MGIEPAGKAVPNLGNRQFCAMADAKCDWRVNFRGMWGNVGLRGDTRVRSPGLAPFSRRSLTGQTRTVGMLKWLPGSRRSDLAVGYRKRQQRAGERPTASNQKVLGNLLSRAL